MQDGKWDITSLIAGATQIVQCEPSLPPHYCDDLKVRMGKTLDAIHEEACKALQNNNTYYDFTGLGDLFDVGCCLFGADKKYGEIKRKLGEHLEMVATTTHLVTFQSKFKYIVDQDELPWGDVHDMLNLEHKARGA